MTKHWVNVFVSKNIEKKTLAMFTREDEINHNRNSEPSEMMNGCSDLTAEFESLSISYPQYDDLKDMEKSVEQ